MDTVIRYRHYRCDELHRFFDNKVFYSRSSRFRGNCPGRPDVLKTEYEVKPGVLGKAGWLRLVLELNKASTNMSLGLPKSKLSSGYEMQIRENQRTVDMLTKFLMHMDKIVADLPLLLYATAHARQVRDYIGFMFSGVPKIEYSEIAEHVRDHLMKETIVKVGLFRVIRVPGRGWTAWIEGDEVIPVFNDELRALEFINQRLLPYEEFDRGLLDNMLKDKMRIAVDI